MWQFNDKTVNISSDLGIPIVIHQTFNVSNAQHGSQQDLNRRENAFIMKAVRTFIVPDWGIKLTMAQGCRTGPPAYVAWRAGTGGNKEMSSILAD